MKEDRCGTNESLFGSSCNWIFIIIAIIILFCCFCNNNKEDKKIGHQEYIF